jgi:hypothetical protein
MVNAWIFWFYKMIFSLQCPFIDVSLEDVIAPGQRFTPALIAEAMGQLVQSIHHRAVFLNVYQSILECSEPDIRWDFYVAHSKEGSWFPALLATINRHLPLQNGWWKWPRPRLLCISMSIKHKSYALPKHHATGCSVANVSSGFSYPTPWGKWQHALKVWNVGEWSTSYSILLLPVKWKAALSYSLSGSLNLKKYLSVLEIECWTSSHSQLHYWLGYPGSTIHIRMWHVHSKPGLWSQKRWLLLG